MYLLVVSLLQIQILNFGQKKAAQPHKLQQDIEIPIADAANITDYSDLWVRLYLDNGSVVTTDDHYRVGFGWVALFYSGRATGAEYDTSYPNQDGSNSGFNTLSSGDTSRNQALSASPNRDLLYDSDAGHYVAETDESDGKFFDVRLESMDPPDDSNYTRITIWELRQ